uniref:Uncharacterized protein n=1 Tax=Arundo donax TaxID=35708 RepID=A0A0A9FJP7_ARUDO
MRMAITSELIKAEELDWEELRESLGPAATSMDTLIKCSKYKSELL